MFLYYLSMTTFLGGGGKHLPEILITLRPSLHGAFGGASLMTFFNQSLKLNFKQDFDMVQTFFCEISFSISIINNNSTN